MCVCGGVFIGSYLRRMYLLGAPNKETRKERPLSIPKSGQAQVEPGTANISIHRYWRYCMHVPTITIMLYVATPVAKKLNDSIKKNKLHMEAEGPWHTGSASGQKANHI